MTILYLYAELMGYTLSTVNELIAKGNEVHIVHWDKNKVSEYVIESPDKIKLYPRSNYTRSTLNSLAEKIKPDLVVVSGWMDRSYLSVCKKYRKKIPVVTCIDNQWEGNVRQQLASVLRVTPYFSRYFSHAWVAGLRQYEFARNIGFHRKNIIYDLYSADLNKFNQTDINNGYNSNKFLFVGRIENVKGIPVLLDAWKKLYRLSHSWELHIIGSGSLQSRIENISGIVVHGFLQPEELKKNLNNFGCFVLPSISEPWGVVVHEMAAAGLPLIVTKAVGSSASFVIDKYNGLVVKENSVDQLSDAMKTIIQTDKESLKKMGERSRQLSCRITPESSAANLLSILA